MDMPLSLIDLYTIMVGLIVDFMLGFVLFFFFVPKDKNFEIHTCFAYVCDSLKTIFFKCCNL